MENNDTIKASEHHNKAAGIIVSLIVRPTLRDGGTIADVLVLCESVIIGVLLCCVKNGGDENVLDAISYNVKNRLAELRLLEKQH